MAERLQVRTLRAVKTTNLPQLSMTIYGWNERAAAKGVTSNKFDLLLSENTIMLSQGDILDIPYLTKTVEELSLEMKKNQKRFIFKKV